MITKSYDVLMKIVDADGTLGKHLKDATMRVDVEACATKDVFASCVGGVVMSGKVKSINPPQGERFPLWVSWALSKNIGKMRFENGSLTLNGETLSGVLSGNGTTTAYEVRLATGWLTIPSIAMGIDVANPDYVKMVRFLKTTGSATLVSSSDDGASP